jgi:hypothetical protein
MGLESVSQSLNSLLRVSTSANSFYLLKKKKVSRVRFQYLKMQAANVRMRRYWRETLYFWCGEVRETVGHLGICARLRGIPVVKQR